VRENKTRKEPIEEREKKSGQGGSYEGRYVYIFYDEIGQIDRKKAYENTDT